MPATTFYYVVSNRSARCSSLALWYILRVSRRFTLSEHYLTLCTHALSDIYLISSIEQIYKLTAPPPKKKAGESDHHESHKKAEEDAEEAEEAEETETAAVATSTASPKHEKDFYPYILIGKLTSDFSLQ